MAERLKEWPEWAAKHGSGPGRREIYPYDDWFDGEPWLLRQGVDFVIPRSSMADRIRRAAKKRGVEVLVAHKTIDGVELVVVKRHKPEDTA
jgi:hypothetical protein